MVDRSEVSNMKDLFTRIRPQILIFGILLGGIALYGLRLSETEATAACIGGLTAIAMKIMEDKD